MNFKDFYKKTLNKGKKVEFEHTPSPQKAKKIATDHIKEFPKITKDNKIDSDYYEELEKVEKKLKNQINKNDIKKTNKILNKENKINNIFNDLLLLELEQKYIDRIKENKKSFSFDNIFGENIRIIIPMAETETYNEIINQFKKIPNFDSIDKNKKEIIRKIKLKTPEGEKEKEQRIGFGKAIANLKISQDEKKKYLNWFAKYHTNITEIDKISDYVIILSRNPVDVARMSDIGKIHSCHSQGGSYFHCALQEAVAGGPVAYLINKTNLNELNKETFQNGEIFYDKERKIDGISAISRIRVRRYVYNDEDTDETVELAIPEKRVYGKNFDGFLEILTGFLKEKQKNILNIEKIKSLFKNNKLYRTGGSYADSSDSSLFNDFFDTETFFGSVAFKDESGNVLSGDRLAQYVEELTRIEEEFNQSAKYSSIDYFILNDDDELLEEIYFNTEGITKFDLSNLEMIDEKNTTLLQNLDCYSIECYYRKNYGYHNNGDLNNEKIEVFIVDFLRNKKVEPDLIKGFYYDKKTKNFFVYWSNTENEVANNTDVFESFSNDIKKVEENYKTIKQNLIVALFKAGLFKSDVFKKHIKLFDADEENPLKNFVYDEEEQMFTNDFKSLLIIPLKNILKNDAPYDDALKNQTSAYQKIKQVFNSTEQKIIPVFFKKIEEFWKKHGNKNNITLTNQLRFNNFEEYVILLDEKTEIEMDVVFNFKQVFTDSQKTELMYYLKIDIPENITQTYVDFVFFIDNYIFDIDNILKQIILNTPELENYFNFSVHHKKILNKLYK